MRRTILSVLLALLVAGPAWAQDDPRPPKPDPEDKEKIRFVDPKDEDRPAGKPAGDEKPGEPDPAKAGLEVLVEALAGWPAPKAVSAIDELVLRAKVARPRLLEVLAGKAPSSRCAAAIALARIGKKEDAAPILAAARDRRLSMRVGVLLEAGFGLDPAAARLAAFGILTSSPRPAQRRASRFLESKGLEEKDRPAVEALLGSRNTGARLQALRLLTQEFPIDKVLPRVLEALNDRSPEVCAAAAKLLAGIDEARESLAALARSYDSRPAAYAALSLALRAQARGSQPFDSETADALIGGRGLRSVDPLSRGVAAIVLGLVGYEERAPEIDLLMESEIVPALLNNVGGSRFFRDRPSLGLPSAVLLEKLTGQSHGLNVRGWRTWWAAARESFVARRRLKDVLPQDLALITLDLEIPGGTAIRISSRPEALAEGAVIVTPAVANGLVDSLRAGGFFGDDWAARGAPGDLLVMLRVGSRERGGALAADRIPAALSGLDDRVKAIRARSLWQRYWDRDDYPRPGDFIRARLAWFAPDTPPDKRDEHLRIVIAEAMDDLPREERIPALMTLVKLEGPVLDDRLCFALLLLAEAEKGLSAFAEKTIRFLVSEGADVIRPRLVDFLGAMQGPRATDLLADSLAGLGRETVLAVLGDARPSVRRAAVRGLGRVEGEDTIERLRSLLKDADRGVRLEALTALGTLKAREAFVDIERAARDDETRDDLRAAALRALGAAGGKAAIPTLVDALRSASVAVRVAAIQGLGATKDPEAIVPLLYAMQRDPYAGVVAVAATTVVTIGGAEASKGLRRLAGDAGVRSPVRIAATRALGGLGDHDALAGLLDDEILGLEAALALALLRDGRAAPKLLEVLASGGSRRVLPALEGLTARTFGVRPAAETATLFIGWWEVHKDGSPSDWLVAALVDRGYEVSALSEGASETDATGLLIRALDDQSWAIRYSASRELMLRTGEDFGRIEKYTSHEDAQRIADLWRRWWEQR